MSKKNNDFFKLKKEWSKTKDKILGQYLRPYFQKLITKGKPICYVDCFAGKGEFDDGEPGSPLIALECVNASVASSRYKTSMFLYFIELNHYEDLQKIVEKRYKMIPNSEIIVSVKPGKFEDNIDLILDSHVNSTVFLYVDPYGIKAIDVQKFNSFKLTKDKSVEMLINFNTWGFFREACRVLKADFKLDPSIEKYLVEYDPNNNLSREELDKIAGSNFWVDIILKFKNGELNSTEAEHELANGISKNFQKKYSYVLNVPIKSSGNVKLPKYRLFYLTNHEHGCIIMAETMTKAIEDAKIRNRNGQLSIFDSDTEDELYTEENIINILLSKMLEEEEHLNKFLCRIFTQCGLICTPSKICSLLKTLEKDKIIIVRRKPRITVNGKITSFMREEKGKEVFVRKGSKKK